MNGWNSRLLLSGSNEHFSGATTGGRATNCEGKYDTILIASKTSISTKLKSDFEHQTFHLFVAYMPDTMCIPRM
jgi:hypothetical protein